MSENIHHNGIIEKIDGTTVYVRIIQRSACSGCHARNMCGVSESKEKIIEVQDYSGKFHLNEEVQICGTTSLGMQAVLLAFVLPLILVFATIAIGTSMQWKETTSGLTGLFLLVPYYCLLYLSRDLLKKKFVFTLKKLN
ncbi:MAG: SoxR reducing system RseC family protein [Parabacteroides sp.]|nr:SoxR reducing system RseC family protein [Parabacteroides sp.]